VPVSQENCNCEHLCPNDAQCLCVWNYDEERCIVDCSGTIVFQLDRLLAQDARIAINVRNVDLARLGEFLARVSSDEVLIPASAVRDTVVEMSMYDTTLGDALREAGLVARTRDASDAS
jgi:hypothetical protein